MSNPANYLEYVQALLDAIIAGRITAKEAREMTPEQHAEYKTRLLAAEQSELDRAKRLQEEAQADSEKEATT